MDTIFRCHCDFVTLSGNILNDHRQLAQISPGNSKHYHNILTILLPDASCSIENDTCSINEAIELPKKIQNENSRKPIFLCDSWPEGYSTKFTLQRHVKSCIRKFKALHVISADNIF